MKKTLNPKFKNRPNPHIVNKVYEDNKVVREEEIWISRASAIVGLVLALGHEDGGRILVVKRSHHMDEPNKMALPSGYLDWDECGFDAITREIWEETSLYLPDYVEYRKLHNTQPFYVQTEPDKDLRQNVSLSYLMVYDFTDNMDDFPHEIEAYTCYETAKVEWMKISDFYNTYKEAYDWAFHHDKRIEKGINHYTSLNK